MSKKSFAIVAGIMALSLGFTALVQAKSLSTSLSSKAVDTKSASSKEIAVDQSAIAIQGSKITKSVCGGTTTVTDSDGNVYGTVTIGSQCWMAQNLRTTTKPDGTCINGGGTPPCPEAVPYQDDPRVCPPSGPTATSDCSEGAMYRWNAAMNGSTTPGAQGICPAGWHIPTKTEFLSASNNLQGLATSEYIRWPAGLGHRIRYHLNGISGTMLPYATTAAEAEARYNYQDPSNAMYDIPLDGFGLFGIESGDEFTGPGGDSELATSTSIGGGMINSYQTLLELDGNGIPTGYSTPSIFVNDAREALQVRCVKN